MKRRLELITLARVKADMRYIGATISAAFVLAIVGTVWGANDLLDAVIAGDEAKVRQYIAANMDLNAVRTDPSASRPAAPRVIATNIDPEALFAARRRVTAIPLHAAITLGKPRIARMLIEAGADVTIGLPETGDTPLHLAASRDDIETVKLLIQRQGKLEAVNNAGCTPVLVAGERTLVMLLDAGAKVNARDHRGMTLIYKWAAAGQVSIVQMLLQHQADPNARIGDGSTPLHAAFEESRNDIRDKMIDLLLDAGTNVNAADQFGHTPLHKAAGRGSPSSLQKLLDKGAKIDAANAAGETPLYLAFAGWHTAAAHYLLDAGANPNMQTIAGDTLFHLALEFDSEDQEIITALLGAKADPTIKNKKGLTPFDVAVEKHRYEAALLLSPKDTAKLDPMSFYFGDHATCSKKVLGSLDGPRDAARDRENLRIAVGWHDLPVVRRFIKEGKDLRDDKFDDELIDTMAHQGNCVMLGEFLASRNRFTRHNPNLALITAVKKDHVECARLLMLAGMRPDIGTGQEGQTYVTLLTDAARTDDVALIKMMLENGANPNFCSAGPLPVVEAFKTGNRRMLELFLAHKKFEINTQDHSSRHSMSLIHAVAGSSDTVLLKRLLKMGANIELVYRGSDTALSSAAMFGQTENVRVLLEVGAKTDPHLKVDYAPRRPGDLYGSPLHEAASAEISELLIAKGAEINARDQQDRTPLMRACERRNAGQVKVMLKRGADVNLVCDKWHPPGGQTALDFAALANDPECVRLLLAAGAIVDPPGVDRPFSVIGVVRNRSDTEVLKLLEDAKAAIKPAKK